MAGSYDFEEQERIAELKAWWEDNRVFVIAAIIAAVVAYAAWEGWKWWRARQAEEAATLYRPVAEAAKTKDAKKVADAAQPLIARHPGSFYASEAALIAAKTAFDAGNFEEARKQLEWAMEKGADVHRGVARTRLAAVLLEMKKHDEALRVLDGNKDAAFAASVADLRGDVMLAQGRIDEARAAYKLAVEKAEPRNPVRSIAENKLNALGGAQ
ncbi:MAG TPA: tetratricopeptide repeat protein [Usitatibacter sp.]|nr:tetratricopeptide repeat protein [Usitatibacter sp.]